MLMRLTQSNQDALLATTTMSAYVEDDDPSASLYVSRAQASTSSMRASQPGGRPFLSMLNPMGRSYAGYRHPEDVVEEEEEETEAEDGISMTATQLNIHRQNSIDTVLEDDEVPASLMVETSDRPKRRLSSQRFPEFNAPPRPSELIQPSLPPPAVAPTPAKTMRGMDDYERALWNWFNVYNLDAFLQEVSPFIFATLPR